MELKKLINGQTLRFDENKRGDGSEIKLDNSVHLHKQMNNQKAQISIYLNKEQAQVFTPKNLSKKVKERLQSEIKKAFKQEGKVDELVKYIIELWGKCSNVKLGYNPGDLDSLESAIINVAKNFGCDKIIDKFRQ